MVYYGIKYWWSSEFFSHNTAKWPWRHEYFLSNLHDITTNECFWMPHKEISLQFQYKEWYICLISYFANISPDIMSTMTCITKTNRLVLVVDDKNQCHKYSLLFFLHCHWINVIMRIPPYLQWMIASWKASFFNNIRRVTQKALCIKMFDC